MANLMNRRAQRQEAIKIMQMVNEAYGRPNPTPWYRNAIDSIKRGTSRLINLLKSTPKPDRVSGSI